MEGAALWAKVNKMSRRDASVVTEEFAEEISQMSGCCIDIGTGPGDVLVDFFLPKINPNATVVCFDVSEEMLDYAKEKYQNNQRLTFRKLDIETPNLPKDLVGKFDHATSFYCLHWCLDRLQVMKNVFNMLRPGGTVILTELADLPWFKVYKEMAEIPRYQPYHKGNRYMDVFLHPEKTRGAMKRLAEDAGFEVRHCSVRDRIHTFENEDTLSDYLKVAASAFICKMPADIEDDYIKDLIKATRKYFFLLDRNAGDISKSRVLYLYSAYLVYLKKPSTE